jgi:hypothetical protein
MLDFRLLLHVPLTSSSQVDLIYVLSDWSLGRGATDLCGSQVRLHRCWSANA